MWMKEKIWDGKNEGRQVKNMSATRPDGLGNWSEKPRMAKDVEGWSSVL